MPCTGPFVAGHRGVERKGGYHAHDFRFGFFHAFKPNLRRRGSRDFVEVSDEHHGVSFDSPHSDLRPRVVVPAENDCRILVCRATVAVESTPDLL